ncbi:hypothetical protein [Mucilaginibacter sp.]
MESQFYIRPAGFADLTEKVTNPPGIFLPEAAGHFIIHGMTRTS